MRSSVRSSIPSLLLTGAIGVAGCGDSAIDPPDDLLDGLDELAIHAVVTDRLAIFGHTTEANAVLRHALGATLRELASVPGEWMGGTAVYDPDTQSWAVEGDDPDVPANVARITWYAMSGSFVAVPVQERGYIDLVEAGDPALRTIGITATATGDATAVLADYVLTFGESETGSSRTERFEANGFVGDGTRQLNFQVREEEVEPVGAGTESFAYSLALASPGFNYLGTVDEVIGGPAAPEAVELVVSATVDGVLTRLALELQGPSQATLQGGGTLRHAGQHIADIAMTGTQMVFTSPDGRTYSAAQQQRLGTLALILLNPMNPEGAVNPYFQ